jgi:hypothetical protein
MFDHNMVIEFLEGHKPFRTLLTLQFLSTASETHFVIVLGEFFGAEELRCSKKLLTFEAGVVPVAFVAVNMNGKATTIREPFLTFTTLDASDGAVNFSMYRHILPTSQDNSTKSTLFENRILVFLFLFVYRGSLCFFNIVSCLSW